MAAAIAMRRCALAMAAVLLAAPVAQAEDLKAFKVEMKDGVITPDRIEVEAGVPFRIDVTNAGAKAAEFESDELHKEKVLVPGGTGSLFFRKISAGTYIFYDDFHPDGTKLTLIIK